MTEVNDVTRDIELNADSEGSFGNYVGGVAENTPGLRTLKSGADTVSSIWQGLPEDPDAADIQQHAGSVAGDTAGFVAECSMEAGSAVLDPVGWLVSNGLDMVLHLVTPLQDALHQVTGDGPRLGEAADDFTAIGEGLVSYSEEFVNVADEALADWQGGASQAAQRSLANFAKGIEGVATSAGGVSEVLRTSSMLMQVIEEVIKAIISEFVSWLIWIWAPALATSIVSFGSSAAAAMSASVAKASAVMSRVTSKMGKLGKLLDDILAFFTKFGSGMVRLGEKLGASATGGGFAATGKAAQSAVANVGRSGAMRQAVTSSLTDGATAGAASLTEQTLGADLTDFSVENGWQAASTVNDVRSTREEWASDDDLGSGATAEDTEDQLKM